ncbi:MAG: cell envelope integrity EipB family protein [Alphaproteobacteria bacterium]|nr:cell envelope integrity EipB family protein [Alphaproteobacteria bacterium]
MATALAAAWIAVPAPVQAAAVQHVPHRGFYEVTLGKSDPASPIRSVNGRMVAEWAQSCDGWTANQRLVVSMQRHNGRDIESEVNATSFESSDGTSYQFSSKSTIGGEVAEEVRGRAERPGRGEPGVAIFSVPPNTKIDLPADTLFPFEHTLAVIDAGEKGDIQASTRYFDGSQPEISPMVASMLILGGARSADEGPGSELGSLTEHKWWSVRMAMFANAKTQSEPEFEMTQDVQDNGVVRRFVFDYGDFTMVASLVRIEELEQAECR